MYVQYLFINSKIKCERSGSFYEKGLFYFHLHSHSLALIHCPKINLIRCHPLNALLNAPAINDIALFHSELAFIFYS